MPKGIIIQSISGFYYVEAADAVYECKARGSFRKSETVPLVGDTVDFELSGERGTVTKIYERKNFLYRPPVANIDRLFIVSSVVNPTPNLYVTDKLTVFAEKNGIEPVLVFSKSDLADTNNYSTIYKQCGFKVIECSSNEKTGLEDFAKLISNKICAFSGNSGVGKSSILNALIPDLKIDTNEISDKLGRGKHTTRSVHLYKFAGGYIADTPGFSSFDAENAGERIYADELADCFPEFEKYTPKCRFSLSCSHTSDKGCAVIEAVKNGNIPFERHESYCRMYNEAKDLKKWD